MVADYRCLNFKVKSKNTMQFKVLGPEKLKDISKRRLGVYFDFY